MSIEALRSKKIAVCDVLMCSLVVNNDILVELTAYIFRTDGTWLYIPEDHILMLTKCVLRRK
jgi:hypothetical protein